MNPLVRKSLVNPAWALRKAYLFSRSYFSLQADDVVLALFPKTGSTWIRYFLYNLFIIVEQDGRLATLDEMNEDMPEFGHPSLFRKWPFASAPRIVKTHRKSNPLLARCRAILVVRDPRDIVVSFHHYARARKSLGYQGGLSELMRDQEMGLRAFLEHFSSWHDRAGLVCRYEDIKANPEHEFSRVAAYLGIPASEMQIAEAIERSNMSSMRSSQRESAEFKNKFEGSFVFARSGESGQWRDLFDSGDLALWDSLRREYGFTLYG